MQIPTSTLHYLASGGLRGLWDVIRNRLERNGLSTHGHVTVELTPESAETLSGVLGRPIPPGRTRVKLDELDRALHRSIAGAGLAEVTAALTGSPLTNRRQVNADREAASAEIAAALDAAVGREVGLRVEQAQQFLDGVRTSGILTKAGHGAALRAIAGFSQGWNELARSQHVNNPNIGSEPAWGIGEFASFATGSAHGFDDGRLAANLMLRALAVVFGVPVPSSGAERRQLWETAGVAVDDVSGTAMTWGFRPPGDDRWSTMIRERTELGLVTHLTVQELRVAVGPMLTGPDVTVFACENPQILSAAARAGVAVPVLCLSGQGSAAAWEVLHRLIGEGATVRYHGDFDWPGVKIATRVFAARALPWRMGAEDYRAAIAQVSEQIPLEGSPEVTPWDSALKSAMTGANVILHEEAVVSALIQDMRDSQPRPDRQAMWLWRLEEGS